jgi:predicted membrane-bound spermidine synthase
MINRLLRERGDALTEAAGSTHAADNIGAALGALLVGLVLIPVLGIGLACFVVALANTMLALCMATAKQTG